MMFSLRLASNLTNMVFGQIVSKYGVSTDLTINDSIVLKNVINSFANALVKRKDITLSKHLLF